MRPLRILTWHTHGSYLYSLSQIPHEIFLPVLPDRHAPYGGRGTTFPFGTNVRDIAADEVADLELDCIVFQTREQYQYEQYRVLSPAQRRLPRIFLEHDPPRQQPTNTRHPAAGDDCLIVHVTLFNRLMWDSGTSDAIVIEHGVPEPRGIRYSGELPAGIVVINDLAKRGRRLGADVFEALRRELPLDLIGMGNEATGGLGEVPPMEVAQFVSRYRFFLNPIRWTSLGLAVCEAMMVGVPILGLATTEMVTAVKNGVSGYLETKPAALIPHARRLLSDPAEAHALGCGAREAALDRFSIERFVHEWDAALRAVAGIGRGPRASAAAVTA